MKRKFSNLIQGLTLNYQRKIKSKMKRLKPKNLLKDKDKYRKKRRKRKLKENKKELKELAKNRKELN